MYIIYVYQCQIRHAFLLGNIIVPVIYFPILSMYIALGHGFYFNYLKNSTNIINTKILPI